MTGASPVLGRTALWAALADMQIPLPDTGTRFEEALAEQQGWTGDYAERVAGEYRRFLYLAATAGFEVTPSKAVDEAWHLHLSSPHYGEILCGRILCKPLEHRIATGAPGEADRHSRQYEDTIALYERAFLKPPPTDIWPAPSALYERQIEEDGRRRGALARQVAVGAWIAAIAAYLLGYPLTALFLAVVATIAALLSARFFSRKGRSNGAAGCGGSCASGAGRGDGDGGSSCGGGCGGGGD